MVAAISASPRSSSLKPGSTGRLNTSCNPGVQEVFNLPVEPGFSELLRGEAEIAATILPTPVRGLWMLPAGMWTVHATEALAQEPAQAVFRNLRNSFDFIIVDSSPILAVVDALLI